MFKFLRLCLKNELKDYLIVILALSLFLSFEYIIWNLFFCAYGHFISYEEQFFYNFSTLALMGLIFMMILFINYFFTDKKKKEFSLILLSGRKIMDIIVFLIMQYGAIFILSNIISMIIGKVILEFIANYLLIHYQLVLQYNIFYALGMFFLMDGLIFIYIMLVNFGMFIRLETKIVNLMSHKASRIKTTFLKQIINKSQNKINKQKQKDIKKALGHISITVIMILSLVGILFYETYSEKLLMHVLANISLITFINLTIPYLFDVLHQRFFKSIILLVSCSNVIYMIKSMIFLINLSGLLIPLIITFMMLYSMGIITQVYMVVYILIIVIMLFISMIFKLSLLIETKNHEQQTLRTLGINNKQLNKIRRLEFNTFYMIAIILPMLFSFLLLHSGICFQVIESAFATMIMIEYIIGAFISYFIIYALYRKIYRKETIS